MNPPEMLRVTSTLERLEMSEVMLRESGIPSRSPSGMAKDGCPAKVSKVWVSVWRTWPWVERTPKVKAPSPQNRMREVWW